MKTATPLLRGWLSPNRYGLAFDGPVGEGGGGRYVSIPDDTTIQFGSADSFSLEYGVRVTDGHAYWQLGKGNGYGPYGWGIATYTVGDPLLAQFFVNDNAHPTPTYVANSATFPRHTRAHLVFVLDRSAGLLRTYLNGVPGGTASIAGLGSVAAEGSPFTIGQMSGNYTRGVFDNVRLYKRILSAAEISAHYLGIFQDERGLVGWWPSVEGSGTLLSDASGNGNNGTLVNAPAWEFFDPYPASMRKLTVADLYTFALRDGSFLRYTSLDVDVVYGGNTFSADAPVIERSRVTSKVGIEVGEMTLTVSPNVEDLINGVAWIPAARGGALDGARVTVQRAFIWNPFIPPIGVLTLFSGRVSPIAGGRSSVEIRVKSDTELFDMKIPRNLVQPGCLHTLFDTGCALSKAAFASNSSADSGSTKAVINCGLPQTVGVFDLGTVVFTSGLNNGVARTVKRYTTGVFHLALPLPYTPGVGDTFTAHPGCDKQQTTCVNKFNNLVNFRGLPFVPVPETAT